MNPDEIKALLKAVASGDRRTTGPEDVQFWAAMATEGRWTLATAMRALVQFRAARPGEWLEPGHLSEIIRAARSRGAASFVVPDCPLGVQRSEIPTWHRAELNAHIDRVLAAWAAGESIPDAPPIDALLHPERPALPTGAAPGHLRGALESGMSRIGAIPPKGRAGPRPAVRLPRQPAMDPDRRAVARAELADREPVPMTEPEGSEQEAS